MHAWLLWSLSGNVLQPRYAESHGSACLKATSGPSCTFQDYRACQPEPLLERLTHLHVQVNEQKASKQPEPSSNASKAALQALQADLAHQVRTCRLQNAILPCANCVPLIYQYEAITRSTR